MTATTVAERVRRSQEFMTAYYNAHRLVALAGTLPDAREAYALGRITLAEYEAAVERIVRAEVRA